jgi:predicted amidohydrolase YtcJ
MEADSTNYAEAVAVKNGKIVFKRSKADAEKMLATVLHNEQPKGKGNNTRLY